MALRSVDHARSLGIDTVYQDLALVNELSVYHNMFLNREHRIGPLLNNRLMRRLAEQHLREMGVDIPDVTVEAAKLSGGQRQAIAVARSVYSRRADPAARRAAGRDGREGGHDHPRPRRAT